MVFVTSTVSPSHSTTRQVTTQMPLGPTEFPAVPFGVHLGFTIAVISLYSLLFIASYYQLWLIFYYKHKRFSYQSVFLMLCLLYSSLRIVLFSFYFRNVVLANHFSDFVYWLLYGFPVFIQFSMLCLLNLYFSQLLLKARVRFGDSASKMKLILRSIILVALLIFLIVSFLSAILRKDFDTSTSARILSEIRVFINESLFVIAGISLGYCVVKLSRLSSANILLEANGASLIQAATVSILTVLLYASRAVYNFIAVTQVKLPGFNFGWTNVSDQADMVDLNRGWTYVAFGVVLILWEFLPTTIVLFFFRVRKPTIESIPLEYSVSVNYSRTIFDDPRRYDSDDETSGGAGGSRAHDLSTSNSFYDSPIVSPPTSQVLSSVRSIRNGNYYMAKDRILSGNKRLSKSMSTSVNKPSFLVTEPVSPAEVDGVLGKDFKNHTNT